MRITGMTAANAVGDKLPMFAIGKAKKPQCLKNIKFLPCRYRNQQKSWLEGILFEQSVRELDRKFSSEGRYVALVIDGCPDHLQIENLKAIKLFSLPSKETSKIQPMDQGVIRSLKAMCHKNVVRKIIRSVERNKTLPKISLLQEMQMLVVALNAQTTQTIVNCF